MSQHNAPSVAYPLTYSHLQGQLLLGLWLAGLAVSALWVVNSQLFGWQQILGLTVPAITGAAAWIGWKNSCVGRLSWDGRCWYWESKGYQAGSGDYTLQVECDFQSVMLLRIDNHADAHLWLWAERRASPERWLDLRRAVYAPQRASSQMLNPV